MSSSLSIDTTFALALAAQAEKAGVGRLDAPGSDATASRLDSANLLATLDPTRAAFVSALLSLDVANAPQVAGPYIPGAASGPLTEDDIFDPSKLYSLPGQELVVVETTEANAAAIAAGARPLSENASADVTSRNFGTNPGGAFDGGSGHPGGAAQQSAFAMAAGMKLPLDTGAAPRLDVPPSALTLELVVAGYMSLRQAGLSPIKRKVFGGLRSRAARFFDDRGGSDAETWDDRDTRKQE